MKILKGNIFTSNSQTLVNTINCVGVMGAGIALEYKLRYPNMFLIYEDLCKKHQLAIGTLWLFKVTPSRWVLNFPTKYHWKDKTRPEYLEKGLIKFLSTYKERKISSVAFPILGGQSGGLPEQIALEIMTRHLQSCDIPVEIYKYDPFAFDDLYFEFKSKMLSFTNKDLKELIGLKIIYIDRIKRALENENIHSLSQLASTKGIGIISLEKIFAFILPNNHLTNDTINIPSSTESLQGELFE